jgi:hypothetical protein
MNARKFLNVRVGLTVTALALSGAMVLSASCAGNGGTGGSSGNNNGGNSNNNNGGSNNNNGGNNNNNGGSNGSGGSSSTPGGSSGSCSGSGNVCFSAGQASGAMTGYGWIAMGSLDSASKPVCAPDATDTTKTQPITKANACPTTGSTVWSTPDKGLCITGSIPALPSPALQADYDNNWGLQIGANTSTTGDTLGGSYSTITYTITGTPSKGLRAELHRKGDADVPYCHDMTSGTPIKMTDFNTKCYDSPPDGVQLTTGDIANLDKVGVQVSSDTTAITVTDLCLTGIQFK